MTYWGSIFYIFNSKPYSFKTLKLDSTDIIKSNILKLSYETMNLISENRIVLTTKNDCKILTQQEIKKLTLSEKENIENYNFSMFKI